jgi:hypothetical protein
MKRSELRKIIEAAYSDVNIDVEKALKKIGKTEVDPETGVKTTLSNVNPETGKMSWDVSYDIDPSYLYTKLGDLVNYMRKAPEGSEMAKIREILKTLKNKTSRLKNK